MACPVDQDVDSQAPGLMMRMTISGITKTFPSVPNISTATLATWHHRLYSRAEPSSLMANQEPGNSTAISSSTVPQRLIILDSRPVEEFSVGHISGSIRVNVEEDADSIMTSVPELKQSGPETAVVCYCSVGYRSSMTVKKLQQFYQKMGTMNEGPKMYNLEGSIFKWANEGRTMVDDNDRATRYAHPYNSVFGKLLNKELRKTEMSIS